MELMLSAGLLLGIPIFMLFAFKSNIGVMFFAACAGLVLLSNLDPVVVTTAGSVVPGEGEAYVRLAVVILSMVFAGMMFKNAVKGGLFILHGVIAVLLGVMLWLTLPSVTGVSWLVTSTEQDIWQSVNDYKGLIIAAGFGLSLIAVLATSYKKGHHRKLKH